MAYTSQGTVSVDFGDKQTTLYFVPEQDYSSKHKDMKFAIFVQREEGNGTAKALIREYGRNNDDVGVEVVVKKKLIMHAARGAWHGTKVEVQVKEKEFDVDDSKVMKLVLTRIRIPAR